AVTETQSADAAVVVVGEKPGAEGELDSESPSLAADQQDLIDRLEKTGKPVAVVVLASRPIVLGSAADAKNLLMGWLPGSEAGTAVASVLFGDANPSGRLPVSWPKTVGDQPMSYLQLPGTNGGPSSNYDPLFPFGHGLSYTTYETRGLTLASSSVGRDGTVRASVTVANTGGRAGTLVVPVYVEKPVSSVLVAPHRLAGFARVDLAAGQQKTVEVAFPISRMAVTQGDVDGSGKPSVSSGDYKVVSGGKEAALTVG
ncbi:MAG: glycoside hydrolase family 3 C-terminal domain-containing protein, partial [Micromonosporaceae bacterium]